ncbi:MAG: ABC transporter substrate-binding protein [Actinomycetota bacterium]
MRTGMRAALASSAAIALIAGACANPDPAEDDTSTGDTEASQEDAGDGEDSEETGDTDDGDAAAAPSELDVPDGYTHLAAALDGEFDGEEVTVLSQWVAEDGDRFAEALEPFEEATGITVQVDGVTDYTTTLVTRVEGGNPPDVAQIAQPGLMRTLAGNDRLVALDEWMDVDQLRGDFGDAWTEMTSAGDSVHGVTWGAFTKSVVWYPAEAFEAAGYTEPQTWDELETLMDDISASGITPWCVSVEQGDVSGWPATDWVEDVLLRTAPPEVYDEWAAGERDFSDPEVAQAFEFVEELFFTEGNTFGGPIWMNETWVGATPLPMFHGADGPDCFFHKQATWIADFFLADPNADPDDTEAERLQPGTDAKFFVLPPIEEEYGTPVLGAADQFVMFEDRDEVRALMEYLATTSAVEPMIAAGGFISPNQRVPDEWYQDYSSRTAADILAAASVLRDDASDGMPAPVGSAFNSAMVDWIRAEGDNTSEILAGLDEVDWEGEE